MIRRCPPSWPDPRRRPKARRGPIARVKCRVGLGNEKDEDVELDFAQGYFNQGDVNEILEQHTTRLTGCYERAGGATKFAGGIVKLRFLVGPDGVVRDVLVIDTEIGNYPVERCLVVEGRKIPFPKPGGGSGADFEYSLEFRSSKQTHVVDWQKDVLRRRVMAKLPSLGRCGNPGVGDRPVAAVAYISPRGLHRLGRARLGGAAGYDGRDVRGRGDPQVAVRPARRPGPAGADDLPAVPRSPGGAHHAPRSAAKTRYADSAD